MNENNEFPATNETLYRLNGSLLHLIGRKNNAPSQLETLTKNIEELTKAVNRLEAAITYQNRE